MKNETVEIIRRWSTLSSAIVTVRDGKILSAVGYSTPRRARRAACLDPAP